MSRNLPRSPRRRRSGVVGVVVKIFVGLIGIALVATVGLGLFSVMAIGARPSSNSDLVLFTIEKGDSADTISNKLSSAGIVDHPLVFRALMKYRGVEDKLQAGEFELRRNMSMDELIATLELAPVKVTTFTIPEGLRAIEIAEKLEAEGIVSKQDFMNTVLSGSFDYDFLKDRPEGASLEGFLFPDTYKIPAEYKARDIVNLMLLNFQTKITPKMRQDLANKNSNVFEAVTMASIIEREAVVPDERPTIASVYFNRLAKNMLLQADPTVQYAVGTEGAWWKKDLSEDDLQVESLYNTYRFNGLPAGPICNPGLASIEAAVYPADTNYLYFVATGDGSHVFAQTLEEHNANVEKYQQQGKQ